jgi:hypothetical protein
MGWEYLLVKVNEEQTSDCLNRTRGDLRSHVMVTDHITWDYRTTKASLSQLISHSEHIRHVSISHRGYPFIESVP